MIIDLAGDASSSSCSSGRLPPSTSATGGYLLQDPALQQPEGQSLNDFLQQVIAGVTGIRGDMVRPRWQPEPPNLPDFGSNWFAFGITRRKKDTFAYERHLGDENGTSEIIRNEELELLISFYGNDADFNASAFSEGIQIEQNREALQEAGIGVIETGDITPLPVMVKERWWYRVDMPWGLRRQIRRKYPILNILTAGIILYTDVGITETINVSQ